MNPGTPLFDAVWLASAAAGRWLQVPAEPVERVCHDTRRLKPGDLYVAIRGERLDGHDLLAEAFEKGAVAALVEETSLGQSGDPGRWPLLVVPDTLMALAQVAAVQRHRCSALVVGITGSMGKTTVKEMMAAILRTAGPTVCTQGNWNNHIGLPLSMLGLGFDSQYGVFEVGMNHPGEIAPLSATLSPDWGVITAIGPVHLEFFDSVASIAREKAELLRALPRTGLAFLHAGDPYYGILRAATNCPVRTLALGQEGDADLVVARDRGLLQMREKGASGCVELPAPAAGLHNVVNAGLAILVARTAGISWDQIRQGLANFTPPPMRWEMQVLHGYTVINDAYNANPVSMAAALETFRETRTQGRKWLVLGDMLELGAHALQAHADLGCVAAQGGWAGIVAVGVHAKVVMDAALAAGFPSESICWTATPQEAGDWLLPRLSRGDAILLKGSRGVQLERFLACIQEGTGK